MRNDLSDTQRGLNTGEALRILILSRQRLDERIEAAVFQRLGEAFTARRVDIREGSLELTIPIVLAGVAQYGAIRSGLDALTDDLANIVRWTLNRPEEDIAIDAYWVRADGWVGPEAPTDESRADTTVGTWLTGAGGFMVATLALIGATDADMDRVRLNQPEAFSIAFLVVVSAMIFGVLLPLWRRNEMKGRAVSLSLVALLVGAAVSGIAWLSTRSRSAKERPQIVAGFERTSAGGHVVGTVTARGLQHDEHIFVRVIGVSSKDILAHDHVGHARVGESRTDRQLIYGSRTGPDIDGKIDMKLRVPVPAGLYERLDVEAQLDVGRSERSERCDRETRTFGCISLGQLPVTRRPRLSAAWRVPERRLPLLEIKAAMGDLSPDDRVLLSVRRQRPDGRLGGRLYGANWAPGADGIVEETLRLTADPGRRPTCVIMRSLEGGTRPVDDARERYGPCRSRSRGVSVVVGPPPSG